MTSFCAGCGASLPGGARFCSACGNAVTVPNPIMSTAPPMAPLVRPRVGRKVAGVCQGFANQHGTDANLLRVMAVLLAILLFPVGLVAYATCWLIVPEEPLASTAVTNLQTIA